MVPSAIFSILNWNYYKNLQIIVAVVMVCGIISPHQRIHNESLTTMNTTNSHFTLEKLTTLGIIATVFTGLYFTALNFLV